MYALSYHRAASLADAAKLLAESGDARLLAGGQTLLPSLKLRLAKYDALIDLKGAGGLDRIERTGDTIVIGALARHAEVAASPLVEAGLPALAALAGNIGDAQVRNRGTIGGSIANNDPAADYPAALLGLNAIVVTSQRRIAAADFFIGLFETALQPGEIVQAVEFPIPKAAAYSKFRHPASRFALVGVFVADTEAGMRVAVTGAASHVFRFNAAEAALAAKFAPESLDGVALSPDGLNSDIHADAAYRAHLVTVVAKRAVRRALG